MRGLLALLVVVLAIPLTWAQGPRVNVQLGANLPATERPGRIVVAFAPEGQRISFTRAESPGCYLVGTDAAPLTPGTSVTLPEKTLMFPQGVLQDLPAGSYTAQAILMQNPDLNIPMAPGNLRSPPVRVTIPPANPGAITLTLDAVIPDRPVRDSANYRYLSVPSKLLSDFHGRPMVYRVGVVLPTGFAEQTDQQYGLVVNIGGFGTRYTQLRDIRPDLRFVQIRPDGAGPFGDPYQVNSANNGPYGDALTKEVIPYIEKTFRCLGTPRSRFTTGVSTGGWVSFALQVYYPEVFNGCWSQAPDAVDFRSFELIDIYSHGNAFRNDHGFERPAMRTIEGDTVYTVRHENRVERALGRQGRWELGGRDWASWNATYGPRGPDGLPVPLWDGETGAINQAVLKHWEQYDLRLVLERNWRTLGPKLPGKIHIWVGDADEFYLNNAVHRLRASLMQQSDPSFEGEILIELRAGHKKGGWTDAAILNAMAQRAGLPQR